MPELLSGYFHILAPYFPLGVIGIWRWTVWVIKKTIGLHYKPTGSNGYSSTLSIVTPVYNEDPKLFRKALESWKENKPEEVIAVIDYTDKSCIEEFEDFSRCFENTKLIVTEKPGKRPALADGVKAASGEIVALVDSDTVWDSDIREKILAPFIDPLVGGVAARQDVLETDTLAKRLFNIHLDHRYFDEMAFLARSGNALTCLSGRTALYRKKAIIDLLDDMVNETFWGKLCISGEDKCLTRLVQASGWKTRYQMNARVRTTGMPDLVTFFKQQTRWIRNSWRSDLKSLSSTWIWRREWILALHMMDRFIQPFTLMLGPIYFVLSLVWGHWFIAGILLTWWHVSRAIKIYPHLRHRPSDLLILPAYVFVVYVMGIIKIYDFFTINKQGWITRWDKDRLGKLNYLRLIPAYAGTAMVILVLGLGVVNYRQTVAVSGSGNDGIQLSEREDTSEIGNIDTSEYKEVILHNLERERLGYYTIRKGDMLSKIAWKYNSNRGAIIEMNRDTIPNPDYIEVGQQIIIPVLELRNTPKKITLISFQEPEIVFDESQNTIHVEGESSIVNLSKIYKVLTNKHVLEKFEYNEWMLKANLLIGRNVTLVIDGDEVSWLKLKSDADGFIWLQSHNGNILISNTKITSWDETNQLPDAHHEDGRSFILTKYNGRMDVVNSELAFLGYGGGSLDGQPTGDLYGVAWRIPSNTFKGYLMTGNALNSEFHDNYVGIYGSGATAMTIAGNHVFNNTRSGIDVGNNSNNLLIENNRVYSNGENGISISHHSFNNAISNNVFYDNKFYGIRLSAQSNSNLLEYNTTYGHVDGIAIRDSHENLMRDNEIKNNKNGIRINDNSSGNYLERNKITHNEKGIFLYNNANNNFLVSNVIKGNIIGLSIKNATRNLVQDSLTSGYNQREITLGDGADDNRIQMYQAEVE